MHTRYFVLVLFFASVAPASAQLRPGAFSTIVTTDTSAASACIGANTVASPTTCTGTLKAGPIIGSGNVTIDTTTFFVDVTANRVGIGTVSPGRELTLSGTAPGIQLASTGGGITWALTSSAAGAVTLQDDADGNPRIEGASTGSWTIVADSATPWNLLSAGNELKASNFTNSTSGTAARMQIQAINNGGVATYVSSLSSAFTSVGILQANGGLLGSNGAGGLSIGAEHASGVVRFYAGGATERWQLGTAGHLVPATDDTYNLGSASAAVNRIFLADGAVGTPSMTFGNDTDTGIYAVGAGAINFAVNGVNALVLGPASASMNTFDNSTGTGQTFTVGRNSNVTTPCAGQFLSVERDGSATDWIWPDITGVLRITTTSGGGCDTGVGDTGGTIVGTQTSTRASKNIFGEFTNNAWALATILRTPLYDFDYKSGAYNGQRFVGIVTDESPEFGMDLGRSFSPVTAFGFTVASFKAQQARIDALQRQIDELKRGKQ